jgi:hypothetical protein
MIAVELVFVAKADTTVAVVNHNPPRRGGTQTAQRVPDKCSQRFQGNPPVGEKGERFQ